MQFLEIDKISFSLYKDRIINLYMHSFGAGNSAQYLERDVVSRYFHTLFDGGACAVLSITETKITGVIVFCPFSLDTDIPATLKDSIDVDTCVYIAELMVDFEFRGLGLAKKLIHEFENSKTLDEYYNAYIRVWNKNTIAVDLYKKAGFVEVASIVQEKKTVSTEMLFLMNKIYLWKEIR